MTNTPKDQLAADRMSFDVWRMLQESEFIAAGNSNWFDDRKLAAMKTRNRTARFPRDAFTGAYMITRAYLTEEAIFWFEHYGHERFTFTDWQNRERETRAEVAAYDVEESNPLADLEYMRDMVARRGKAIVAAREDGASWAQIMTATGLSRMTCNTLAKNYTHPAAPVEVAPVTEYVEIDGEMCEVF